MALHEKRDHGPVAPVLVWSAEATGVEVYPGAVAVNPDDMFKRFDDRLSTVDANINALVKDVHALAVQATRLEGRSDTTSRDTVANIASNAAIQQKLGELDTRLRLLEAESVRDRDALDVLRQIVLKLEQARWWLIGGAAGAGAGAAGIMKYLV